MLDKTYHCVIVDEHTWDHQFHEEYLASDEEDAKERGFLLAKSFFDMVEMEHEVFEALWLQRDETWVRYVRDNRTDERILRIRIWECTDECRNKT